jgi:transcription initiation factor IIE alpha subunit
VARSTCPKCDSNRFECTVSTPSGSNYSLMFVQCSACGAVVGVMDSSNIGAQNQKLKEGLQVIAKDVKQNQQVLEQVVSQVKQILQK